MLDYEKCKEVLHITTNVNMDNVELKHLQNVILGIMKDIDSLCQENNIEYYLLGGSAIGAIRHHGFIPWDDDLDIIMDCKNYDKFISVCKEKLNREKYSLQEGLHDWSMYFSKIRLKGTKLVEGVTYTDDPDKQGIYVDIFKMDNVPSNRMKARWQYFCAKTFLCYQLSVRGEAHNTFGAKKKIMMLLSFPLRIKALRKWFKSQVEKYNKQDTPYWGFFYGRTNFRTSIVRRDIFGKPVRVPFEDTQLCVAEHYHEYLTQMFGDYMTPPPVEKQSGLHVVSVDFGKY